jgi:hypothetical protein
MKPEYVKNTNKSELGLNTGKNGIIKKLEN